MSKYPRTYHLKFSPGATNDDRIAISHDSILGIDIVITEKLDGSNGSIVKNGVYGRSHAEFSRNPWDKEMWNIWNRIKKDIDEDMFVFGENLEGIHSIEYTNLKSYFYIFGIRDNNIWIPWDNVEEFAYLVDLPTVPVLYRGIINTEEELNQIITQLSKQPSSLGGIREGVVIRNASLFHNDHFSENVMKFVRKNHVTTDKHWTKNWTRAKLNS
jgi:ATP-dependent RNA circularization protein (DNA/RNA ligase family)